VKHTKLVKDPVNGEIKAVRSVVYPERTWYTGKEANGYGNGNTSILKRPVKAQGKNGWRG